MRDSTRALVSIAESAVVGDGCTLGYPREARLSGAVDGPPVPTLVSDGCLIFNQVILYEGVQLGTDCVVEDRARLGYDVLVGARTRLVYGAYICDRVRIGCDARVGGFVCDGVTIGDRATTMGQLVHEYSQPHRDWWEVDEAAPVIEADSIVGYGAVVVGGVRIGPGSYVAAGATVTKDVPPLSVVVGRNMITPMRNWAGDRLQALIQSLTARYDDGVQGDKS